MQMLDLNALQQPTWPVKLRDDEQTVVNLTTPDVELVDRLMASAPGLREAASTKDGRAVRKIYDLLADVMNCNEDGFIFTGEELQARYNLRLLDVYRIIAGYMEFIKEINEAKN